MTGPAPPSGGGRKSSPVGRSGIQPPMGEGLKAGIADSVVLWNTLDLGYLVVKASQLAAEGTLKTGVTSIDGGKLGSIGIEGTQVVLGKPLIFTKANIDNFDF